MGYSLRDYERVVPPANRLFHEQAERVLMYREGVLPLDEDGSDIEGDAGENLSRAELKARGHQRG